MTRCSGNPFAANIFLSTSIVLAAVVLPMTSTSGHLKQSSKIDVDALPRPGRPFPGVQDGSCRAVLHCQARLTFSYHVGDLLVQSGPPEVSSCNSLHPTDARVIPICSSSSNCDCSFFGINARIPYKTHSCSTVSSCR